MRLTPSIQITACLCALVTAGFTPALAAWSIDPWENTMICEEEENQYEPVIVGDAAGGCIVAWVDERGGSGKIYVQRLDPAGAKLWPGTGIQASESNWSQKHVRMVEDGAGGAILVWQMETATDDIQAQRIAADGSRLWGTAGVLVANEWYSLANPEITSDTFGGAVIVWQDADANNLIYAQRFNESGSILWNSSAVQVRNAAGSATDLCMTDIGGGGAVIAWTDTRDTDPRIYAQYVSSAGTCIWAVNGIKATTSVTDQEGVDITTLGTTAVLAFTNNPGSSSLYISCQRLSLSGARIWGSSGIRVSYEDGHQILPQVTPDEDGGVLVAWTEFTAIDDRIHAQRLTAAGDRHWTSNGALVNDYAGEKGGPRVWADGEGGCLLSWVDTRHYLGSIYAQRLDANGMRRWHEDGVQMSGTTLYEDHQSLRDDRGGLIAVWGDDREGSDSVNIYAQRMHATGYLADPQPVMTEVSDFPNDQGGRALVTWDRCYLDAWPWTAVESYSVWVREAEVKRPKILDYENCTNLSRHLGMSPETLAEMGRDGWTFVDDVPAVLEPVYSCAAFTFGDSTSAGIPMAEYRVLAHSDNPAIFWESEPMFGYSVDNLAPGAPLALNGLSQGQGEVLLTWSASGHHDEDLSHYVVYRGAEPDVPQDPDHQVGTTVELTFIDPSGSGTWFYQVTAMDVHENESEGSNEIQVEVTSSDAPEVTGLPLNLALHVRGPNPFVEQTTLAFDLPEECEVDLLVCSVDGRRVARLVQGVHPAGRHRVSWRGRDADGRDLPPGVYFARMRVGSSTYRVRLAHVR